MGNVDMDALRSEVVERLGIAGLAVEVRGRTIPKPIADGLADVEVTTRPDTFPVLVLCEEPLPLNWAVVCMYFDDFVKVVTRNGGK